MNDEVKEAASRRERWKMYPSHVKPFAIHEYCQTSGNRSGEIADLATLADAYLAELDETPPSPELLNPLGFVEKDGEWSIRIPSVRMVLSWSPVDAALKEPGDFPMPHTMGQIRTLLRVFGVKEGEKK